MTIYLIEENQYVYEDYNGRDCYEYALIEWPGYFTSEGDAQDWIDQKHDEERADYDKRAIQTSKQHDNWESECAEIRKKYREDTEKLKELGIDAKITPPRYPYEPKALMFDPTEYRITEIDPNYQPQGE